MTLNILRFALLAGLALLTVSVGAGTKLSLKSVSVDLPTGDRRFPEGAGSDLANSNCLSCHSADMVLNQAAQPKAVWDAEVGKMREAYKAPIDPKDVDGIVAYLVSIRGAS
jgi:mono/diheme cytochrome c family protein